MCSEPVTLGGGMTMQNGFRRARDRRGSSRAAPTPDTSAPRRQRARSGRGSARRWTRSATGRSVMPQTVIVAPGSRRSAASAAPAWRNVSAHGWRSRRPPPPRPRSPPPLSRASQAGSGRAPAAARRAARGRAPAPPGPRRRRAASAAKRRSTAACRSRCQALCCLAGAPRVTPPGATAVDVLLLGLPVAARRPARDSAARSGCAARRRARSSVRASSPSGKTLGRGPRHAHAVAARGARARARSGRVPRPDGAPSQATRNCDARRAPAAARTRSGGPRGRARSSSAGSSRSAPVHAHAVAGRPLVEHGRRRRAAPPAAHDAQRRRRPTPRRTRRGGPGGSRGRRRGRPRPRLSTISSSSSA